METTINEQFKGFTERFLEYMPDLVGGIILILIGWLLGWIIKRILIQLSVILKVERFFGRARYEASFSKADVRHSFYSLIGNVGFTIIFLIFLDNAFLAWKLKILSDLLSQTILFLPKIIIALVIMGIGWLIASFVQISVLKALAREAIPRSSLISKFVRSILLVFFSAIAFVELDVAREIIIIAFATIFLTLGIITIVLFVQGGKNFLTRIEESFKINSDLNDNKSQ